MFTYEGDETIDLLKEQVAKFDAQAGTTTTIDTLPGSGAPILDEQFGPYQAPYMTGPHRVAYYRLWDAALTAALIATGYPS